jgi:hypothetical protein
MAPTAFRQRGSTLTGVCQFPFYPSWHNLDPITAQAVLIDIQQTQSPQAEG